MKPLSAPTGPGWWWALDAAGGSTAWLPVEVCSDGETTWVEVTGSDLGRDVSDFDAWLPLPKPEVKP